MLLKNAVFFLNTHLKRMYTQGNCATEGNSGNCQSGNCHSGERWMRKPSVHGGK